MGYRLSFVSLTSLNHRVEIVLRKGYIGRQCFGLIEVTRCVQREGKETERERERERKGRGS